MVESKRLRMVAVSLALLVNVGSLIVLYDILPSQTSSSWSHIPGAYNFYKYGTLSEQKEAIQYKTQKAIPCGTYDLPQKPSVNDTVGYAFLVGSLWKITHSLDLLDVQVLQILLFCVMIFLLYKIFFLLFQSNMIAFIGCLFMVSWYDFIVMNITPSRDIWGFYGGVVLAYVLLQFFLVPHYRYRNVLIGASFFAFCQFLRPNIFGQCFTLCGAFALLFFMYRRAEMKSCSKVIAGVIFANILFFWVPFVGFNKQVYGRYFVGPLGHGLLASLGTVDNPWGLECKDEKIIDYVVINQEVEKGDVHAIPDAAMRQFLKLFREDPRVYITSLLKTIKLALFYEIEVLSNYFSTFEMSMSFLKEKLYKVFVLKKGIPFFEFFLAKSMRIMGYCGIFFALVRRERIPVIFLIGGVFAGVWMLVLSHFEERYIIPFSWPFAVFASYFLVSIGSLIVAIIKESFIARKRVKLLN